MKKTTAHKQNRFLNCLRIQVVPGHHEEQRIESIVTFCKKYSFDNVMLFINSEEYCVGHMTKEEAKPWIAAMKRAKKALINAGISVSLNPWIELGHLDRGRVLKDGQDFLTMQDFDGNVSTMVACPMDEKWQAYFLDFYEYLIREIEPEVIWVEDDFRLHNHGTLKYGGCFCEHHMKAFNEALGSNYSREEFTDRLFRKKPEKQVQQAFLDVNRRCMVELAEKIGTRVKSLGLGTKVALMSSAHQCHSMEGRDWNGILKGLTQGGPIIDRIHMPMYLEDVSMKNYYQMFNLWSFVNRGYMPEGTHVLPELENGAFSTYAKDSETLRFQVEAALPLEIEGMTYDIFDFVGNGAIEAFGYGPAILGITDYMTAVCDSGYTHRDLQGITLLLDEKNAYHRPIVDSFWDMEPDEFQFGTILQAHGISVRCSQKKEFQGEIVVLAAGSVYNFSEEQLKALFSNNHVILEGKAAMLLIDRGLGDLIGASAYRIYKENLDVQSYEEIEGDRLVNGIPGYRAGAICRNGDYVALTWSEEPEVLSRVYDFYHKELGYGTVVAKGHLVVAYTITEFCRNQLHPLRGKLLYDYLDTAQIVMARTDQLNVYAYYSKAVSNVLILVNTTLNTLPETKFKLMGETVQEIYEIERDGVMRKKEFYCTEDGFLVIQEKFNGIMTKTFVIF